MDNMDQQKNANYGTFAAMVATSTILMFGLMYLNTYALSHVFLSETRIYMTLIMGAVMTVVMLTFMRGMYRNKRLNMAIYAGSAIVFIVALFLVRSQALVGDAAYMEGMIPHHSIAILTSERANIQDMRVRELADGIIDAQRREIAEMKWLLMDIGQNGIAADQAEAAKRPVPEFSAEP